MTTLSFDVFARDRASKTFDHLGNSVDRSAGSMQRLNKVSNLAFKAIGAGLVGAGIAAVKFTKAAGDDEAAQKRLAKAAHNAAGATKSQTAALEGWVTAQGKALGVTDDDLRPALGRLVAVTHDLGQAEKDASLAMDVSAGTGKSLESITMALVRARNGSLGGLSRLGIATKDADGKTKSLAAVTKELAALYRGQAAKGAETAAGKQKILTTQMGELEEQIGAKLLPVMLKLEQAGLDAVEWISENADEIGDHLKPALQAGAAALKTVYEIAKEIPEPLRGIVLQAGLAAVVLPKMSAALGASGLAGFINQARDAETRTAALTSAAKTAAGVGGLVALTSGLAGAADEGAQFGDILKGAAGGAGIGAMFGPIGALIGAGAGGGLTALAGAFADTKDEARAARLEMLRKQGFENARADANSLREALQGVINAYGDTARAAVEASFTGKDGKLDADVARLKQLGVSMDTIVSATLGQADAQRVVNNALAGDLDNLQQKADDAKAAYESYRDSIKTPRPGPGVTSEIKDLEAAWKKAQGAVDEAKVAQDSFSERVKDSTGAIAAHGKQVRDLAASLGVTVQQYRQWPKSVRTRLESNIPQTAEAAVRMIGHFKALQNFRSIKAIVSLPGADLSKRQINELARKYALTPKQIRTLIKLEGLTQAKGDLSKYVNAVVADAPKKAKTGGQRTGKAITDGANEALVPGLEAFKSSLTSGVKGSADKAIGPARSGGRAVGLNMGAGLFGGLDAWAGPIASKAYTIVHNAVVAANQAADAHSPSRKTTYLGSMLGAGLVVGMDGQIGRVSAAGRRLVRAAIGGAKGAVPFVLTQAGLSAQVASNPRGTVSSVNALFAQAAKDTDAVTAAERKLKQERKGGKDNTKAIHKAEKELTKARDAATASTDAAKSAMESVVEVAKGFRDTILGLGAAFGGSATSTTAQGFLAKLLSAGQSSSTFGAAITGLRGAGLSENIVQQLLSQGATSEGLALAQSLLQHPELIAAINAAQANLENLATWIGTLGVNIPGMWSGGTVTRSGAVWVGEKGPELLTLPRGSQVMPVATVSRSMSGGLGGPAYISNFNGPIYTVDPKAAAREIEQRRREMASLVGA